ncbi:isoleucine--tRNA ligase [Arthrobacter sp. zg-ZUI100]|uniref:Isoleucine--tRNA ligase n=1 Tax=Arthrobacter jiangjiafuii TaxID=2817475 RepID=A0A975M302_9MICC|nr:isoleucine--tRNA ligase [Arthrobacter jiangjiafuii]MBP3036009.1 isoleucine--tRNA ligase [Arthrobacter jiangjiafuii]MBP3043489.1 isoleucine--tRNA ligase [Arthrobacter jiangjiafuii]QWC09010.1 isoleucine--tRNA ligase [Arthrobacter jiangjiafuii]
MTNMPSIYPKATTAAAPAENAAPSSPRFPELEERVLKYWDKDGTFQASIDARPAGKDGANEFVFYDGPPFANGLPHYGHLLTGYAKDLVARYQTQRGRRVERRFGWDTHGLPAELEAMKQLGMSDKVQIEKMGIDKFNDACRASVMEYAGEWRDYVTRQARWVDFENDYKTLNVDYMESVIWAFKTLHEKGLTYSGFRVLPYCWKDETPLSNHELRMDDDVYKDRQDQTVTVTFPITAGDNVLSAELEGVLAIAWTTTPWTLPTNMALAVGPSVRYAVVPAGPNGTPQDDPAARYLLAEDLVGAYAKDLGYDDADAARAAVTAVHLGKDLAGLRYAPLWDYYTDTEKWGTANAWQIVTADYVTTTDGTGIVHQAPAYGEDDQKICEANGIPVILSVDEGGKFLPMFGDGPLADIAGQQVFDANKAITKVLRADGRLLRQASYEHSYPHCWRCRNPLIYKAVSSWFVEVTKVKDRMVELNQQINWIPENVKDGQFGKWIENARDWSISRNRYWGSPIPVWVSDDPNYPRTDVYGSLAELKADFGRLPVNKAGEPDLHRPFIDELTRPNPDDPRTPEEGQSTMRRVEDVLDVWFDSGSMPYAQVHYPHENAEWFENHNPGDFIVEYIGQTRGWFYTLHVLATALFDRPAFRNVISHGIVLGSDGQKMSKSLRNYPDVSEVLDRDGSDAMRWFLMSSPILRGGNLVVTEQGIREAVRQVILPLWNVWHFFTLYTNAADNGNGYEAKARYESSEPLDNYMLAATGDLVRTMTGQLDSYDVSEACETLRQYMDTLTNWYIRRSRNRFFDEDAQAFDVLYTCLETVCRVAAPLLPLISEEIWRGLTGGRSVHLTDWPDADLFPQDEALVDRMDRTRRIASVGSSLRKAANLRVRLPLSEMTVVAPDAEALAGQFAAIIADELNLKSVRLMDAAAADPAEFGITQKLVVNARAAGPRLGKNVQTAIKASKSGDWSVDDAGTVTAGGLELQPQEYTLETVVETGDGESAKAVSVLPGGGFLVLNTEVTPELAAEGTARDGIRAIQQARRDADLHISDHIRAEVRTSASSVAALEANAQLIKSETLTDELVLTAVTLADDDEEFTVTVEKI